MYDFEVVIDAGHGGDDPGAVSGDTKEKDLTLQISRYMYDRFKELGVPVAMTRTMDETVNPTTRVNRILNAFGDNPNVIVISNHINSSETGAAEGAEVIYALRNDDTLATNILNALGDAGQKTRLAYQRRLPSDPSKDYYYIHRNTGTTQPVIVEYGFINNEADLNRIKTNYREYVDAVVNAVIATEMGGSIPPVGTISYVVKKGDSLYKIAQQFDATVNEIKRLNSLTSDNIFAGQILLIPAPIPSGDETKYIVKAGDSLWSIAQKFNTTVDEIKKINNLTSNNLSIGQVLVIAVSTGPTKPEEPTNTYTVKSGDSLWSIARKFNTTVNELKQLNNLTSDNLSIGQVLRIPNSTTPIEPEEPTTTYTVRSGDSLWSIARKFNTTVDELKRINGLTSNNLRIGQTLKVPRNENSQNITYVVKSGDSLYKIAQTYNTTVDAIKRLNNLTSNSLMIGQVLQIPQK